MAMIGKWKGTTAVAFACGFLAQAAADSAAAEALGKQKCIDTLYRTSHLVNHSPRLPTWSRDGKYLAFVWDQEGGEAEEIWVYEPSVRRKRKVRSLAAGAGEAPIEALQWLGERGLVYVRGGALHSTDLDGKGGAIPTSGGAVRRFAVSPDASYIAYAVEGGLWIVETSEARKSREAYVANGDRVSIESIKWSGDSKALAFVVADDGPSPEIEVPYFAGGKERLHNVVRPFPGDATTHRRIGVVDIIGAKVNWLERRDPEDLVWHYEWAAHKRSLLVDSSDFLARNRQIIVHDTERETATVHYSFARQGGGYRPYWSASWAPDDQGLIILSDYEGFYHLYHQRDPGEPLRPLSEGSWEVASFEVDRRNGYIYFVANRDHVADRQIYRLSYRPGNDVDKITGAPGTYAPTYSPTFDHVAFSFSDDSTPPELYHQVLAPPPRATVDV